MIVDVVVRVFINVDGVQVWFTYVETIAAEKQGAVELHVSSFAQLPFCASVYLRICCCATVHGFDRAMPAMGFLP